MDQISRPELSPFRSFSIDEWARLRAGMPMTLTRDEIVALRSIGDPVSLEEVERVYLPISRLLSYYVTATQGLFDATRRFLGTRDGKTPISSESAGRWRSASPPRRVSSRRCCTAGRRAPMSTWSPPTASSCPTRCSRPRTSWNARVSGKLRRPGAARIPDKIKGGEPHVTAPVYSHLSYDIVPGETISVDRPDILILEGLNVLQPNKLPRDGKEVPFVSDFFDFSVYIDAEEERVRTWYVERFMRLKETRFRDPRSYFHRFADLPMTRRRAWRPACGSASTSSTCAKTSCPPANAPDLILSKDWDHSVGEVALRKL
jgi:type I pantothenate kinase